MQERAASIPERFGCELELTLDEYTGLLFRLKKLTGDLYAREARVISAPTSATQNEL